MDKNPQDSEKPQETDSRSRRIIKALADWLELLSGPPSKVFTEITKQKDWPRLLKLVVLSLSFSGVALGVNLGLSGMLTHPSDILLTSKPVIYALLGGVLLAASYGFVAGPCRIKIKLQETFFVILSLCLPWLPLLIFADALRHLPPFPLIWLVTFLAPLVVVLKALKNFIGGVAEVSTCPKWRVSLSVIAPVIVALILIILMYGLT